MFRLIEGGTLRIFLRGGPVNHFGKGHVPFLMALVLTVYDVIFLALLVLVSELGSAAQVKLRHALCLTGVVSRSLYLEESLLRGL